MRDFTLAIYRNLCSEINNSGYLPITVEQYCREVPHENFIIIRHDVDRKIEMALEMADLERSLGIRASYYFRKIPHVFNPDIIKQIKDMGHEIGYHYEVLDKAKGNKELAIRIFEKELQEFREFTDIKTICMHGNPLARWSNNELWQDYDFRDFGIIGEPYLSIDYSKVFYLSDTGRTWNSCFSVKDIVKNSFCEIINSTQDIIDLINKKKYERLCILVHPNRWTDNMDAWLAEMLWQNMKNIGKACIKAAT
ncbi:MAG TPA: hypothetical protein VIO11_07750 [Candidatus Methanoperedens sp.]